MKNLKFWSLFFFISCFVSCNQEFGEKIRDFVNKEVPALSKQMAVTGIERRIYEGKFLALLEMSLEVRIKTKELYDIEIGSELISEIKNSKGALSAYDFYYGQESKILRILNFLIDSKKKIIEISKFCDNGSKHNLQHLVSADIFNITLPKKNYTFSMFNDDGVTIIVNLMDFVIGSKTAKQIGIMEEALSKIPEKIASQNELENIFEQTCKSANEKMGGSEHRFLNIEDLENIRRLAHKKLEILRKEKKQAVALYYHFRTKDIYRSTGLSRTEALVLEMNKIQQKHRDLTRERNKIRQLFFDSVFVSRESLDDSYHNLLRHTGHHQNYLKAFLERDFPFVKMAIIELERQLKFDQIAYEIKKQQWGENNDSTPLN